MHAAMACIIHATESVAAHQTPVATYKIERKISAIGLHNAHIRPFFLYLPAFKMQKQRAAASDVFKLKHATFTAKKTIRSIKSRDIQLPEKCQTDPAIPA
jgi:hypothetical protein